MMNYPQLLSLQHFGDDKPWTYEPERPSWQIDHDRIIFSFAFRRLQDKTQVHPLSSSDFVRTRLTHSLEVSTVARSLGAKVGKGILERHGHESFQDQGKMAQVLHQSDFGRIVAAAALMHDIGNPPFGHSGEDAIRYWASKSKIAQDLINGFDTDQKKEDFLKWEGNAAAFRIVTRNEFRRNNGGMRLTYSTLAAGMKYPTASDRTWGDGKSHSSIKKFGFFHHDQSAWEAITESCGLLSTESGRWCRHPLVYLTEAADDICYRLIDLQDGVSLGLIEMGDVEKICDELLIDEQKNLYKTSIERGPRMAHLHALCIGKLVSEAAEAFKVKEQDLLNGHPSSDLLSGSACKRGARQNA